MGRSAPVNLPALASRIRQHYGWVIVAVLSVTETVSWGIVYYGFPVFLQGMEEDLGASRVAVTGAFSLGLGVSAAAAVPVGRWLDRHGPRALMTAGSCLATVLMVAWARVESLPALYAVWFLMGLAMAAILYEPAFVAIVQWFTHRRDRALLTLTLAAGLASTIFMPIESWLVGRLGWRTAILVLTVVLGAITIPLHALALRPAPGTAPAARRPAGTPAPAADGSVTLPTALASAVFWVLAAAFFVANFATVSVTVHLIPYLAEHGYPAAVGARTVGWMGAMQLPGRLFFVPIAAWLGARAVTASIFLAQAVSMVMLARLDLLPHLAPLVVVLGAANGMSTLARATTVAEVFGRRHYGSIAGAIALGANAARALGPVAASLLSVVLAGYARLFWLLAAALGLAGLAVLATPAGVAGRPVRPGPAR